MCCGVHGAYGAVARCTGPCGAFVAFPYWDTSTAYIVAYIQLCAFSAVLYVGVRVVRDSNRVRFPSMMRRVWRLEVNRVHLDAGSGAVLCKPFRTSRHRERRTACVPSGVLSLWRVCGALCGPVARGF